MVKLLVLELMQFSETVRAWGMYTGGLRFESPSRQVVSGRGPGTKHTKSM